MSWIERARALVSYNQEAQEFILRIGDQLPATPADAPALGRLWVEADRLDELACSLLDEMNAHLLEGKGGLDTTRGASLRPSPFAEATLYYDCSWILSWDENAGISINLAIDAGTRVFEARVLALGTLDVQSLRFPVVEADLKEALVNAYVIEATQNSAANP